MPARPNVLVLAPWLPLFLDGGSRRVWTLCRSLRDRYRFVLATFLPPGLSRSLEGNERAAIHRMVERLAIERVVSESFERIHSVPQSSADSAAREFEGLFLPPDVRPYHGARMRETLGELVRDEKIDLVHVEFDVMGFYARSLKASFPSLPCVLTHHDLGIVSLRRPPSPQPRGAPFARLLTWARRVAYTRRVCESFDAVVTVTAEDRRRLSWLASSGKIREIPTGVDLDYFRDDTPRAEREPDSIVYVGYFPNYPNVDAAVWYAKKVLPLVWKSVPTARFYVVGAYPTEAVRALARQDSRIVVTGGLHDVRPRVSRSLVMAAPVRLGRGIKGKILEGAALGVPVVATGRANEGIGAIDGREILLADSPDRLAEHTIRLLRDPRLWETISSGGRAMAGRHDWAQRADALDLLYRGLLDGRTGARLESPSRIVI